MDAWQYKCATQGTVINVTKAGYPSKYTELKTLENFVKFLRLLVLFERLNNKQIRLY